MSLLSALRRWVRSTWQRLIPKGTLKEQTARSGLWALVTNVLGRGLSIVTLIVLARLLEPSDFGLMGIALISVTGLKRISNLGLKTALIQNRDENVDRYLNTAWSIQIVRGVFLLVLLVSLAPLIASVFDEPRATPILRVIALSPLLLALRNPGIVYFEKNLEFHMDFLYKTGSSAGRFVVSIVWALVSPSVWALVAGFVFSDLSRLVLSYLLHDYRPRPRFNLDRARELIDYGKWITASGILHYAFSQGDDAVVGWLLSTTALGFYQLSYRIASAPATEVTEVISSVLLPMFSQIQHDTQRLREAFFQTMRLVALVIAPMAVGILAVAPEFVRAILGEQWVPMITTMQILAVFALVRAFGSTYGTVFKAVGHPEYTTKLMALNVLVLAVVVYPAATGYGIDGVAMATLGALVIKVLVGGYFLTRVLETGYLRLFSPLLFPFVASALMGGIVLAASTWLPVDSLLIELVALVVLGVVSYAGSVLCLDRLFAWGITSEITTFVRSAKG